MQFANGNIVCTLFNDVHPRLVDHILSDYDPTHWTSGDRPAIALKSLPQMEEKFRKLAFESLNAQDNLLYYSISDGRAMVFFSESSLLSLADQYYYLQSITTLNNCIVGIVSSGNELVRGARGDFLGISIELYGNPEL